LKQSPFAHKYIFAPHPNGLSDESENTTAKMVDTSEARIYDEIEIEDMTYDPVTQLYTYPCPCGDRFEINIEDLRDGEEIAICPSCSLMIRVIYEVEELPAAA